MTVRYFSPRLWAEAGYAPPQIEWLRSMSDDMDKAIVTAKVQPVVFNYDGTDYQSQRTEPARYTYDVAGTYLYQNGSSAADANREYPWLDSTIVFYRNSVAIRTLTFRHLCNYGIEAAGPGRIGSKVRSYLRTSTGTEREANFTVQIGSTTGVEKWDGVEYTSGDDYDVIGDYGGDGADYQITVVHTPTNTTAIMGVSLNAIAAVAPFYVSGGGGYK